MRYRARGVQHQRAAEQNLRRHLPNLTSGQVSGLLKRLRTRGLIKKIGRTYKYYATRFGKQVASTALTFTRARYHPQTRS